MGFEFMGIPFLPDLLTIFGLSIVVLLICHQIRLPVIVGFIVTGILSGPHGLALIKDESQVQALAQIGIILLLFTVGMEFSFKKILHYKRYFLIGGSLQVGLTVLGGLVVGQILGRPFGESIFLGFLLALSSTAIVVRVLEDKRETDSPHGHLIMGVMIFQDIVAIPMMLMTPMLAGSAVTFDYVQLIIVGKGLLILAVVLLSAAKLVPPLLHYIARTGQRDLFLLSVLTICFTVAWLTDSVGLSLSLGAFLAGLTIADTEYRTEAISDILPFQGIFTGLFFVSIGMLLDLGFVVQNPVLILLVSLGVLLLKFFFAGITALVLGTPLRTMILASLALCQVGEFSFVLIKTGIAAGFGDPFKYQLFLSMSLLTMAITPTLMSLGVPIANFLLRLPLPTYLKSGFKADSIRETQKKKDHIIIVGYGLSGRNLVRSAKDAGLPYLIIDLNADTVKMEKRRGEPIYFGDAAHESVLHHAGISEAKVLAVVINDVIAAERVVEKARQLNKNLYIIARTRYLREMPTFMKVGADEVIPDEFGSSVEIFIKVLNKYHVPTDEIQKIVSEIRIEGYEMCRLLYKESSTLSDLKITLSDVLIETFRVGEESFVAGKSIGEIELRKVFGVTAMLIRRGAETIAELDAQTRILPNDVVVICGSHDQLVKIASLFKTQNTQHAQHAQHEEQPQHSLEKTPVLQDQI
jgi:monovalent cation:H+ antiporter-2, CPA2 family